MAAIQPTYEYWQKEDYTDRNNNHRYYPEIPPPKMRNCDWVEGETSETAKERAGRCGLGLVKEWGSGRTREENREGSGDGRATGHRDWPLQTPATMEPEREERSARVVELPKERGGRCERREQLGLGFAIDKYCDRILFYNSHKIGLKF